MACADEPEAPRQLVYLAIGASDAAGVGAQPVTDGYVYVIADELEKRIDEVFPTLLAIPGADAEELDAGLDRLLERKIEPDLVTIWTGANDVIRAEDVDDFGAALDHMLERLRERTDGIIVAANIPISPSCRAFARIPTPTSRASASRRSTTRLSSRRRLTTYSWSISTRSPSSKTS
jgi:acyl-CoA thioesterase I